MIFLASHVCLFSSTIFYRFTRIDRLRRTGRWFEKSKNHILTLALTRDFAEREASLKAIGLFKNAGLNLCKFSFFHHAPSPHPVNRNDRKWEILEKQYFIIPMNFFVADFFFVISQGSCGGLNFWWREIGSGDL